MDGVLAEQDISGVVVGYDGSENSAAAIRYAVEEGKRRGVPVHVIATFSIARGPRPEDLPFGMVASVEEMRSELQRQVEQQCRALGVVQVHALHAPAVRTLLEAGERADVVVVGARGRGGFEGLLLGSVAEQVVRHARCPVVVVPAAAR